MSRYIDCEACKDHFHDVVLDILLSSWDHKPDIIIDAFLSLPKADVQPVVHAKWVCHEPEIGLYYSCSRCGYNTLQGMYKFCPNCGAKMDGSAK